MIKRSITLTIFVSLFVLVACQSNTTATTTTTSTATQNTPQATTTTTAPAADPVVATLNGQDILESQILPNIKGQMMKVMSQMYEIKMDAIDQLVSEKLLEAEAKKQGTTVEKLIDKIRKKAGTATEAEAKAFYESQKGPAKNKPFDDVKMQIIDNLSQKKQQIAIQNYISDLHKSANVTYHLDRPRAEVSTDDDPSKGDKNAPIILIEFSEFQCPFCKRVRPTIAQILGTYGSKIHYVFRDYPLPFHNQAKQAANAAECANEQGKYWEYHTELWNFQGQHTPEKLKDIAKKLGLNSSTFDKCVDSNKYYSEIDKDQQEGANAGVSGTPAYFINGVFLSGAQPFDSFKKIIDDELSRKK